MANGLEEIGGIEELVDINTRQQRERDAILRDKENAQAEFDAYARDFSGEPLDMARVEAYKDKVEPWRFEQSLANLEDDYFKTEDKDQASRYTPILDKYLLDNPDAYVNLDAKNNRDIDIAWTEREESHHFPIFSGESREDLKNLSDDEYKMFAVAGYIAESEELDYENVVDNLEIYSAKYAAENGLTSPELDSVFSHISGNLTERKQARDNDRANWQRGVSSVLQGLSLNDALADSVNDKGGAITSAARAQFLGEYGSVLPQAKDIFDKFAAGTDRGARFAEKLEKYRDPIGILQGIGSAIETPKQQQESIADLALMPREQRRKTLAVIWMMAEDQAGEMEAGGWGKLGESFMRGLDVYVENIDDAIDTSVEKLARDGGLTRIKREMRQDLRDVREIVSEIKSDNKFVQGVYDAARSTPYMLSAAVPYGGVLLNAASMATDNDIKLRRLYPDMSPEDRWRIASSAGVVQSAVERLSFKTWIKGFPSASQWVAGKGVAGKVGVLGLRGAGILVTENLEEAAQSATLPAMQALWGAFADDIPEVTDQDWEDSLFIYDEKTFFATLPLAILGSGGRTAYEMIGAAVSKDMLSDVDRVMLHGFSREEAQSIAGESSSLKQWLMFKEGSDAKSREERKELSEGAINDGALDRVIAKDEEEAFQKHEEKVNKSGTEEEKVTLEVQKIARDYNQKYDARIEQDGEQFNVEFPEVANRPTQTYETKDEADNALKAYHVELNESYLETLSSASANIQAMTEQKKVLETKQEGAKIKIGGEIVGLKEFAEKSDENMKQALERIEHELLKMGEIRPATKADLDKWRTRGQVKLKKDARGYVARLSKGANIADLVEEGSEGFLRDLIKNGFIEEKWVKGQILQYQELTGNKITTANSVEEMSSQQMVEAFSDMAVANFYNAHQQDVTGKIGSIINALRIFFAKVAQVAEDLLNIRDQIDADFQTLLDNSVGLDMDTRVEERIAEEQSELEGEMDTFSIGRADVTPTANTQVFPTKDGGVVGEASFSISAFHGTPHKVDRFSTEQIGTGEGAQAYGWGLYFAESAEVAENYRIRLAYDPDKQRINGRQINDEYSRYTRGTATEVDYQIAEGLERLMMHDSPAEVIEMFKEYGYSEKAIKYFEESDYETFGGLYQVELNVEQDELLDWDKPLSEQSEQIQEFARSADVSVLKKGNRTRVMIEAWREGRDVGVLPTGRELYNAISDYRDGDIQAASQALHATGIKGIKYLDGDSRGAAWTVSSPEETKAGDWMAKDSTKPFSDGVHFDNEADARAYAEEKSKGSYNYVIFNDADITIKTENGQEVDTTNFSISPAQDADYMSAVESGDMETAQSMVDEAARAAGYSTDAMYHGSKSSAVDVFDPASHSYPRSLDSIGTWFTSEPSQTKRYAPEATTYKVYLREENPIMLAFSEGEDPFDQLLAGWEGIVGGQFGDVQTFWKEVRSRGYGSIALYGTEADKELEGADLAVWKVIPADRPQNIKSADPVTYDSDGNVIPLSQRFDPSRDEISFSLAPAEDTIMERITAMMRDPEQKMEVYKDMASRLRKVRERIYQKYIAYGKITDETMTESEREMDEREFIMSSIAQMEAIANVLPPEVRSSLGTMKKLSTFKSGKGMRKYLTQRLDKVDSALEKYFRKELRKDVNDLIKRSQPKGRQKAADTGQSKIGVVGHEIAKAAKKAIKMSPEEAGLEAQKIRTKLDNIEEPTVDEIQENEDVAYVYELFADIANADSNRLTMMKQLLKTNWDEGRKQWKSVLAERKAWKDGKIHGILTGLDKLYKSQSQTNKAQAKKGIIPSFARELTSFYQMLDMLKEEMKAGGGTVMNEIADDFRRASNAFEWRQLQHKEEMKEIFSSIFGIKGTNRTARVQARLNSLSKGVDWGSSVTISLMYDYKVAGNAAELDEAYNKLQADPELDSVDIRGKSVSRNEFDEMYIEYQNAIAEGFVPNDRNVFRHTINRNTGERASVGEMSQLDLLKDWLAVQQLDLKDKYDKSGHDEQYREELFDALDEDVKELGLWMQNKLREMTPETDRLHRSEYGLAMATVDNYFPAVFEHLGKQETSLQIDGIDVAGVSKRPSAHKMRVNHNSRPLRQNAVNTFNHHIMQNAFWETHAEVLRKWAGVLRDKDVQDGVLRTKGAGYLKTLNSWLDNIETQGSAVAQAQIESDRLWRSLAKGMALGVLGLKLSTIMKNIAAGFNVALGVEAKYLIKGLRPELFKEAKELLQSETFQRRLKMGATVATRYALEGGKAGNLVFSTTERLAEAGIQGINIADTGSNMTMALAYTAKLRELRSEGVSETEAKAQALDYVDDLMARFAQPTDRLSKSLAENTRMPQAQFIVMFQSEVRKMMAINALAIRKLVFGKGAQTRSLAAQQLIVQVVLINSFIHAVSALYGALFRGFGEGDDAEEKFINDLTDGKKLASNILADSLSGVPVFGEAWAAGMRTLMGQDTFSSTSNPALRSLTGVKQLTSVASKWDEKSASENADTLLRGLQSLTAIAPQIAVISQTANVGRDSLGFLNNALSTGLSKQDTFKIYEKRIKKVVSYVHADSAEEMKQAKEVKDFRMIRSIETQRRDEITSRAKEIFLEMSEQERQEFIKLQREKENGIQKYILREFRID